MTATAITVLKQPGRAAVSETQPLHEASADRVTRLLCARVYLFGLFSGIRTLRALFGPPLTAHDPGIGYWRSALCYHALQSTLLSLVFLVISVALFHLSFAEIIRDGAFGPLSWALVGTVVLKVALVNPWLGRVFFRKDGEVPEFNIPIIGLIARVLRDRWCLETGGRTDNTYYFKGKRPFVGYGTETSAWTIVIDTSAADGGLGGGTRRNALPAPIEPDELYEAVQQGIADLEVCGLEVGYKTFVEGEHAREEKRAHNVLLRKPPQELPPERIAELDSKATRGRRYMVVQSMSPSQDLVATQFLRFHKTGKFIFCEFASYVLSPAVRWLYALDRMYCINSLLYALSGLLLFVAAAVPALLFFPFIYPVILLQMPDFIIMPSFFFQYVLPQQITLFFSEGFYAHAIIAFTVFYLFLFLFLRGLRWLATLLGIALGLKHQFGIAFSYRERFTSRGQLQYYELQEIIRYLKIHEKILINSLYDMLKTHGVDASDFKESVTAFINQGVINSGDIRGNVFTSVKSFVFRRPARSAIRRSERSAARA
jgi:hypothetical protein